MNPQTLNRVKSVYEGRKNLSDRLEVAYRKARERVVGFDYSIFDKVIRYYAEVKGEQVSQQESLARALNKAKHKQAWHDRERASIEDKMHFYLEVDVYPFRQAYNKRLGGFRWYRHLVDHIAIPSILEYGCGSAILTEYLVGKFPDAHYSVADIPSVTLDYVKWKRTAYRFPYEILTIGMGDEGIPIVDTYDLIICQDVLEHTPNPLAIITAFVNHLSPGGVLVIDFLNAPGGENLIEAVEQREAVKDLLKQHLITLKAIDEQDTNNGLYIKDSSS